MYVCICKKSEDLLKSGEESGEEQTYCFAHYKNKTCHSIEQMLAQREEVITYVCEVAVSAPSLNFNMWSAPIPLVESYSCIQFRLVF